jgi:GTP-binding protein
MHFKALKKEVSCMLVQLKQFMQDKLLGLNTRQDDLEVNICKEKHLTNMRSSSSDGVVQLTPYTQLSLEQCLDFIENDELLEVTPKVITTS